MKKGIVGQTIVFTFEGEASVTFDPARVSAENRRYAELHGFMARIGDNAAISKSAENGWKVTEKMRREAVLELIDHYHGPSQEWNVKRAEAKKPVFSAHIQALAEKMGRSYSEAEIWFNAKLLAELESEANS